MTKTGGPATSWLSARSTTPSNATGSIFRDGSHIDAGARHLWDAQVTNNGKREKRLTTEEIYRATMRYRARHAGDERENRSVIRIPVARALEMPERKLPVDPYVYGFWLGNGNAVKPEVTVRTCDVGKLPKAASL